MSKFKFLVIASFFLFLSLAGENKAMAESAWKKAGLGVASVGGKP